MENFSPLSRDVFRCLCVFYRLRFVANKTNNLEDDSVLQEMDFLDLARYSSYIIGVKLTNL